MDNQLLITQPEDFKTQFRQTHKNVLNFFYAFSGFLCVLGVLFAFSSFMLYQKEYHKSLQITIIVISCIMIAFVIVTIYLVCNMNGSSSSFTFISLLIFLIIGLICIIAILSQFFRIVDTYCNYNITHSGFYDGSYIIDQFQIYNYSICSSISHSDQTSYVYNLVLTYLEDNCGGVSSCIDLSSLHIYYMYSEASFQLAALIIGGILDILYIAVILKIRRIVKYTNQIITTKALAQGVLVVQIPNQNQNTNVQPVQINPQTLPPIGVNSAQALQNQNFFNYQQNNPQNHPYHGQQQLNLNPGIQYQQQSQQQQYQQQYY
ncbi:hypothetical protein ABPG72_017080 [Tetrahymena utriculariae]